MNNPLMKKITHTVYKPSDTQEDRREMHNRIVEEQKSKKLLIPYSKENLTKN